MLKVGSIPALGGSDDPADARRAKSSDEPWCPMTHPQQEYIITEDHVKMIEKRGFKWMARLIRSKLHTITTSPAAPERLCDECNIIELEERLMNLEQDLKDARKEERKIWDATIKNFEESMDAFIDDKLDPEYIIRERLHIELESLRGGGCS